MPDEPTAPNTDLPETCLPEWEVADLPEPRPLTWRNWAGFIGPGIVMCGIQTAGGEWLLGAEITARYGGSLMWIALVAIICQLFYNMECGRYALYTGEPVMTGIMRGKPGPGFWVAVLLLLSFGAFIPGLSTTAAAVVAAIYYDRPLTADDAGTVQILAYLLLGLVSLPILFGGKIYNTMQAIFTGKVVVVLGFCFLMGILFVSASNWGRVFSGFLKFGNVPVVQAEDRNGNGRLDPGEDFDRDGHLDVVEPVERDAAGAIVSFEDLDGDGKWDGENVANLIVSLLGDGTVPLILLTQIALIGAFAGYAGGGGLGNSLYANYVRDKGWGMGSRVGAIPSAIGGRKISLSHLGKVFPLTGENLARWRGWWKYILTDQLLIWGPGCVMGMALPALISIEFSPHSEMFQQTSRLDYNQGVIMADGIRHDPRFSSGVASVLWVVTLVVGLVVLLPSQMSIVEDVCRRWTDIIWSGSRRIRESMGTYNVKRIYYRIMIIYVSWTFFCAWLFTTFGKPKTMILIIANFNNLALGLTAVIILRNNLRFLPGPLRPGKVQIAGMSFCAFFYLGLAFLVFYQKQWPVLKAWLGLG